jgi:four helix bundle protein
MQNGLAERLLDFSVEVIKVVEKIRRTFAGRQIAGQLVRSSTSAGANYEEPCGAESRSDFIHKMQIVLKELKESIFWLKLISKSSMISPEKADVLKREADELSNIIAKSIVTAKRNRG